MTMHRQTKELPVYALLVGKNGPKLKDSAGFGEFIQEPNKFGIMAIEPADGIAAILSAVQSQLGLKLEQRKGPVEILVIEHSEKAPVEN